MNLKVASASILAVLAVLLLLCALLPNTLFIMGATALGSLLIVIQTYAILKEDPSNVSDGNYKVP